MTSKTTKKRRNLRIEPEFPWVDGRSLQEHLGLGEKLTRTLRVKLSSPVYWTQPDRKVIYNLRLWQHYLLVGAGQEHDRLVEEYLSSLPSPK